MFNLNWTESMINYSETKKQDKLLQKQSVRAKSLKGISSMSQILISSLLSSHASSQYTEVHSPTPEPTVDPLSLFDDDPEEDDDDDGTDEEEEEETVSSTRV